VISTGDDEWHQDLHAPLFQLGNDAGHFVLQFHQESRPSFMTFGRSTDGFLTRKARSKIC
jgi:hypothetical protein